MHNGIGIRAFGCNIAVVSDSDETLETLQGFLLPSLPRVRVDVPGAEILLRILHEGDGFQLICNDRAKSVRDVRTLATDTVRLLDEEILARLKGLWAIHAGAVEIMGRALLLPGGTHAGKSALVAELLRHGAVYLSDEYALIDAQGRAHPYPRPLMLRHGTPEQTPWLPKEFNAAVGAAPVPVGWILSLVYDSAARWGIAAIPQSEALLVLLRNTPHVLAGTPGLLAALARAAAGASSYSGRRGGATDAVENILRLAAE
jgi:hypothetical protein